MNVLLHGFSDKKASEARESIAIVAFQAPMIAESEISISNKHNPQGLISP